MEAKVIEAFKDTFKLRKDIGNEYFEGDCNIMMNIIYNTITLFKEEDIESTGAILNDSDNDIPVKIPFNYHPDVNITRYQNCDILINQNDIEKYGFDKDKTEQEMIELAIQNGCPVVVKSGESGKWYLKGKDKSILSIKHKIEKHKGKFRNSVYCILIEPI